MDVGARTHQECNGSCLNTSSTVKITPDPRTQHPQRLFRTPLEYPPASPPSPARPPYPASNGTAPSPLEATTSPGQTQCPKSMCVTSPVSLFTNILLVCRSPKPRTWPTMEVVATLRA